jgi:hypothetical protein
LPRVISSPAILESGNARVRWPQLYLGLSFTTLATLMLELTLTRIFSVVFYYHLVFLAISVALFGLGAGGVFSYVIAARRGNLFLKMGSMAIANALAVVGALWFLLSRTNDLAPATLAAVYFVSALPFFFAGVVTSLAISESIDRVDRAYFFDLAGAAAGCLLLIRFLDSFGGPNTMIAAAVFYAAAAAIWFNLAGAPSRRAAAVLASLLLVALMVINFRSHLLDIRYAKGQRVPAERFVAWNSFSRVGVHFQGIWSIVIDADAATGIASFDWDHLTDAERHQLTHEGPGIPYLVRPGAKTLVLGAGGGYDVARAFASGSRDITAVEINPIIARTIMCDKFVAENHGLYLRPEVHLVVEDGRSFVRGSREKFQVLQATLVDTWASTAAGAFALSENNLYTTDAFADYLDHLTDDGLLAFTRWGLDPPRESLRLISLAIEALGRFGETEAWRNVMVIRSDAEKLNGWGAQDTVLISRRPFSAQDVGRIREGIAGTSMQPVYLPGDRGGDPFATLLTTADRGAFYASYQYNVTPVSDDRPFFFYTVQPRDIRTFLSGASRENADFKINHAVPLLFSVLAVSAGATILVLIAPRALPGTAVPKRSGVIVFLLYFLCLGAAYILIQVALIQRFVLLLGHPTYALTVIVFSMLVASGAGSYFSRRVLDGEDGRLVAVLAVIAVLVCALAIAAPAIASVAASWSGAAKMAITTAVIFPPAFFMGMPFPAGLRRMERRCAPAIRWAWSVNAAASVLGSAGAIVVAIYAGLEAALFTGAGLYVMALMVVLATKRQMAC